MTSSLLMIHNRSREFWIPLVLACLSLLPTTTWGQFKLEEPPFLYLESSPSDAATKLQTEIEAGNKRLAHEPHFGFLRDLLRQLKVPVSSQGLVYSKTSLQVKYITPRSPRAIYFNDDIYVGWVPGGNIEISAVDPKVASNFYLLDQKTGREAKIARQTYECLQCHSSMMTRDVPGHVVRSVFTGPDGHVIANRKSFLSDHTSPFKERWGGWYVTGEHGALRHLGNQYAKPSQDEIDWESGANVADLNRWFDTSLHLSRHSDIVALMVLEHQVNMHNRLAQAGFIARQALHEEAAVKTSLQGSATEQKLDLAFTMRKAAEPVVEHLLFSKEFPLTSKVVGGSGFAEEFAQRGPLDTRGRSLREFDLQTRLFKYPCSYVIYSPLFEQLPPKLKDEIFRQLWQVLTEGSDDPRFRHLTVSDRQAILEILKGTLKDLPAYWTVATSQK